MTNLYGETHRQVQAGQNSRPLADLIGSLVHPVLTDEERAFVTSRDFFFLASVDGEGRPTVSYKGGPPGFVRVIDASTLEFPIYDGNGMYLSAGNVAGNEQVGLLFIDFETPNRLRVQGAARLAQEGLDAFPGARLLVRVDVRHVFVNCGRYIHKHVRVAQAAHVPDAMGVQPIAAWQRIDSVQSALPPQTQAAAAKAGLISPQTYAEMVKRGEA